MEEQKDIQQQQTQEQQQQQDSKVSAAQRKQENNHKFQLNKRFGRFMDQMKQSQLKNKIVHKHLLLQKQQQPEVFSTDAQIKGLLIMHHGDGNENDYNVLREYLNKFGENKVYVFPAFGYGYATFTELKDLQACLKSLDTHMFDQIFKFKSGELSKQYYENPEEQYVIYYNSMQFINHLNQEHSRFVFFAPSVQGLDFFETKCHNAIENATCALQIPGLIMIHNFITEEEEKELIAEADQGEWSRLNKRQVQHYGHEFIYGPNKVNLDQSKVRPFPEQAQLTADKINKEFDKYGCKQDPLNQLTINSYEPGSGIPPHVDAHSPFEEYFAALSTGDGCVMSFKNIQEKEVHVFFPQRTLVIFSGEARYGWQHSIASRKVDKIDSEMHFRKRRISYTYRVVRKSQKCDCQWNYFCDSQGYNAEVMGKYKNNPLKPKGLNKKPEGNTVFARTEEEVKLMEKMQQDFEKNQKTNQDDELLKPSEVEKTYVYDVYEKIAPHFSSTRYKPWPKVTAFLDSIPQGSLVADVGCGNGKYLSCRQNKEGEFFMIGTDRAQNFMEICREREKDCQVFSADSLKLPWRSGMFDAVISIAVIHHFSNDSLRIQALSEIHRIMNDDGRALIYVWAMEQKEKDFQEQDIFVPWHNQFKFEEKVENMEKKKNKQEEEEEEKKQQEVQKQQQEEEEEKKKENSKKSDQEEPLSRQEQLEIEAKKHKQKADAQQVSKVDAEKQSVVYKRYYHVFKEGELEELVKKSGLFDIEDHYFDHANWVVILRKKKQ